ncbi:MAG: GatB/YqeY domain-containing protein [Pseudomonadota bacterium]
MRNQLNDSLKTAVREQNKRKSSTLRLINAAIKDRDIALRAKSEDRLSDEGILELLAKMVKQREESQRLYEEAGRLDLADQESEEIDIIREFMPQQLSEEETGDAVTGIISEVGATGMKDMGKVMAALKAQFAGQIDAGKASAVVKERLSALAG